VDGMKESVVVRLKSFGKVDEGASDEVVNTGGGFVTFSVVKIGNELVFVIGNMELDDVVVRILVIRPCSVVVRGFIGLRVKIGKVVRPSVVVRIGTFSVVVKIGSFLVVVKIGTFSVVVKVGTFSVVVKVGTISVVVKIGTFLVVVKMGKLLEKVVVEIFSVVSLVTVSVVVKTGGGLVKI
jgi:hypothetical protein